MKDSKFLVIVVLAILILGGWYFWSQRSANDSALNAINQQSTSDEATAIQADLNATDPNKVDYDLNPTNFTSS